MRALVMVDHGSSQEVANLVVERIAEWVRAKIGDTWIVQVAHLERVSPSITESLERCVAVGATEVVVHPFFLAPGKHATIDVPRIVQGVAKKYPNVTWTVTEPLGPHPWLARLVLERAGIKT